MIRILFISLLLLTACPKSPAAICEPQAPLWAVWETRPGVVLCNDSMPISSRQVLRVLAAAGEINNQYIPSYITWANCDNEYQALRAENTIVFTGANPVVLDKTGWSAYTYPFFYKDTKTMHAASIHVSYGNSDEVVLHEYMHAHGWAHATKPKYLMYPKVGISTNGLENYQIEE